MFFSYSAGLRFVPQVVLNNRHYHFLDNLKPGVFFNVTIKQFKDNCPYYTYSYIKTNPWGLDITSMAQSKYVFIFLCVDLESFVVVCHALSTF